MKAELAQDTAVTQEQLLLENARLRGDLLTVMRMGCRRI